MNERVLAGQSIETLLAVLMFVLMGIALERSKHCQRTADVYGAGLWPAARWSGCVGCGRGRVPWPLQPGLWARQL